MLSRRSLLAALAAALPVTLAAGAAEAETAMLHRHRARRHARAAVHHTPRHRKAKLQAAAPAAATPQSDT